MLINSFDIASYLSQIPDKELARYERNQVIFSIGDPADRVFYVRVGRVALFVMSEKGQEAAIGIIDAGEMFGQVCVLQGHSRETNAVTISEEVHLIAVPAGTVVTLLREDHDFAKAFILDLARRIDRVEQELIDRFYFTIEQLLARALLQLKDSNDVVRNVSQDFLARRLNTSRSSVGKHLRKFHRAGLIEMPQDGEKHPGRPRGIKLNVSRLLDVLRQAFNPS